MDILFEARLKLPVADVSAAAREMGIVPLTDTERREVITQAVQNAIGHTGAQVTCVFEED